MDIREEEQYILGFNAGYLLADTSPDLAEAFHYLETGDEYVAGIKDGRMERIAEREAELLSEFDALRNEGKDNDKNIDR